MDDRFALIGGGPLGSIGARRELGAGARSPASASSSAIFAGRRRRARYNFPLRPIWAEVTLAVVGCFVALGATWVVNAYPWPERVAAAYANDP